MKWAKSGLTKFAEVVAEFCGNLDMYLENDAFFTAVGTANDIAEMAVESAMDNSRDEVTDDDIENALALFFGGERWPHYGERAA